MAKKVEKSEPKRQSIQSKIRPIGEVPSFITMLCYGKAGTGKTAFAASFPKPLLLIDIREKGHETVAKVPGIDLLQIEDWEELEEAYWMLDAGTKYASVVIDQVTQMQQLGMNKLRSDKGMEPGDTMSQRTWGELSGLMQTWLYNFRELYSREYHICFNAHERLKQTDGEEDDRIDPSVGANMMPSVASFLNGAVSVIGNTFIREHINKESKERTVQYCMRVGAHAYYAAKIRRPIDAGPIPDVLVNPTFDKILKISKGENVVTKVKKVK